MTKFYLCAHCGNLIGKIIDSGVPVVCCGEPMGELIPNSTGASIEKHMPVVTRDNGIIRVNVGSTEHPMSKEHNIDFIYLQTSAGGQRKVPTGIPEVEFAVVNEKPIAVFAYCNLHGLWKTEI